MAQAYKCDFCGKFYTGGTMQIALAKSDPHLYDNTLRYDICSDCEQSFHLWKESRNPDHKSAFEDKEDQ